MQVVTQNPKTNGISFSQKEDKNKKLTNSLAVDQNSQNKAKFPVFL